jgi:alkylhydroperoxidase family enzyme
MPLFLPPLSNDQAPEAVQTLFAKIQARMGTVLNLWRTMAHAPDVLTATLDFLKAIHRELPPMLRELAYLRTSQINGCVY